LSWFFIEMTVFRYPTLGLLPPQNLHLDPNFADPGGSNN
jgi:hypothetical protein